MKYKDRSGKVILHDTKQDKLLKSIYNNRLGRMLIKPFLSPTLSRFVGAIMDTRLSTVCIVPFVKLNQLDLSEYKKKYYSSYNDFFTREIKEEMRPINKEEGVLITPADGKLSVYTVKEDLHFTIKNTEYTVASLLKSERLAEKYKGGYVVVVRLTVDNYHRYCYVADGQKGKNHYIKGVLHTVNPIANDYVPVYKENAREFCRIRTEEFGEIIQMEVGAMMVGRICNYHSCKKVKKGEEKGKFEFGGSTVVLLLPKDTVEIDRELLENTKEGYETLVKMGERIGRKK
ncbi:MAG: phosphatidylserine decarboxylase [Lachnospiraceae bacterium]|nr:phosphatidylserine decarboxylase [Lachnospiraceae bacterium]